jgi:hypothetical protein
MKIGSLGGKDLLLSIVMLRFCHEATYVRRTLNFGTKQFIECDESPPAAVSWGR